jgi:anti-sigma factor RsiW
MPRGETGPALACARVRVLMEAYVDGELVVGDPPTAEQIRAHIATCEDCRRQHDQAASLPFRLRALRAPEPPESIATNVMRTLAPQRGSSRRAWALLIPEGLLLAFIVWYLAGFDGLARQAAGAVNDLQVLLNWGVGADSLPSVPVADVFLLVALIALAITAAYHLSVLSHLGDSERQATQSLKERRRA